MARIVPRKILPERVFGRRSTTSAALKLATGPMRSRTSATASASISAGARATPALSTRSPSGTWPLSASATPITAHSATSGCAVMGVADALKGQVPLGLLVLKAGVARAPAEIEAEAVALVRERIGPVASFKAALVVERLPKTRSGKILRGTMRAIADGGDYRVPATIDDPAILPEIAESLRRAGYGKPAG